MEEPTNFARLNDETEGSRSNNINGLSQKNPLSLEKVEYSTYKLSFFDTGNKDAIVKQESSSIIQRNFSSAKDSRKSKTWIERLNLCPRRSSYWDGPMERLTYTHDRTSLTRSVNFISANATSNNGLSVVTV